MLTIRLFRTGKKNQPFFKVVVTEKQKAARRGRFVEEVGSYNPLKKTTTFHGERVKYWIGVGAKASPTVHNLLVKNNVVEGEKINIRVARPKAKEEEKKEETPVAAQVPQAPKEEKKEDISVASEAPKEEKKEEEKKEDIPVASEASEEEKKEEAPEAAQEEKAPEEEGKQEEKKEEEAQSS
jgi:small subunit ribosomal protein S16